MADFGKAPMNAFGGQFPNAQLSGCYFHLGQNIWRNIQTHHLQQRYSNDANFALEARMIPAPAFVTPAYLDRYFDDLSNNVDLRLLDRSWITSRTLSWAAWLVGETEDDLRNMLLPFGTCMAKRSMDTPAQTIRLKPSTGARTVRFGKKRVGKTIRRQTEFRQTNLTC